MFEFVFFGALAGIGASMFGLGFCYGQERSEPERAEQRATIFLQAALIRVAVRVVAKQ